MRRFYVFNTVKFLENSIGIKRFCHSLKIFIFVNYGNWYKTKRFRGNFIKSFQPYDARQSNGRHL